MADAAVLIRWGTPVRGREAKALEVFGEAMAYYGKLQQDGAIENFEPVILQQNATSLSGFVLLRGTRDGLNSVVASDDFQAMTARASLIVDDIGVVNAFIGAELMTGMARLQAAIASI